MELKLFKTFCNIIKFWLLSNHCGIETRFQRSSQIALVVLLSNHCGIETIYETDFLKGQEGYYRTIVELKHFWHNIKVLLLRCYYRTIVELKPQFNFFV